MSPWLGLALSTAGALIAYLREGRGRTAGILTLLAGGAVSVSTGLGLPGALLWLPGPAAAAVLLTSAPSPHRLSFDALARRSAIGAGALLLALIAAAKLPIEGLPFPAIAPLWLVGAAGLAWLLTHRDSREFVRGAVLVICGGGGVLVMASSSGRLTAGLVGLLALLPLLAERWHSLIGRAEAWLESLWLALALLAAGIGLSGWSPSITLGDLTLSYRGMAGPGLVIIFLAAAVIRPVEVTWAAVPAALSLLATSTPLRWSALAATLAVCTIPRRAPAVLPWLGLVALGLVSVLAGVAPAASSYRSQAAFLAAGLLLFGLAARDLKIRALAITPVAAYALETVQRLPNPGQSRFQLVSLAGAACLIILVLKGWPKTARGEGYAQRDAFTLALLLLAVAASSPLAILAVSVLLVEIAIISPTRVGKQQAGPESLQALAHSGWPPAIAFAARVLAVIATLQQSVPLGVMAIAVVAALQLTPLTDRKAARPQPGPVHVRHLLPPLISMLFGLAPEILRRMAKL
jgi:hypothetical protein